MDEHIYIYKFMNYRLTVEGIQVVSIACFSCCCTCALITTSCTPCSSPEDP
jgi:hypothetical protein